MSDNLNDTIPPVEVTTIGNTRILKIGDLTINIDKSPPEQKLEAPTGILFHFDKLLADLITFYDGCDNELIRDALLATRYGFSKSTELVGFFQTMCANCVVIHPDYLLVERAAVEAANKHIKECTRIVHQVDRISSDLYVGDDLE